MGLGLLLVLSACGAALAHTVEFHLGLGNTGSAGAAAAAMLAECSLTIGLVIVALVAAATGLALLFAVRSLACRHGRLIAETTHMRAHPRSALVEEPRRPVRFAQILAPLLGLQIGAYALANYLWPMGPLMRMNGVLMHMAPQGPVPLLPLHLTIALLLAALIWRLERRLTTLHAAIATLCLLLQHLLDLWRAPRVPTPPSARRLSVLLGPAALSRPPPH